MIPLAICAAPRTEPVFQRSIASTHAAGFRDVHVFAEPKTEMPDTDATIHWNATRLGEWHNWLQSANWLLRHRTSDTLATMQDDILLCRNVAEFASRLPWPEENCGCVHLYTSAKYAGYPRGISPLRPQHIQRMAGACLMLFSRAALETLVSWANDRGWRGHTSNTITDPSKMEGLDTYIGEVLSETGYSVWVTVPSLGEHIAKESTLGHGGPYGNRRSCGFIGEHGDALTLL